MRYEVAEVAWVHPSPPSARTIPITAVAWLRRHSASSPVRSEQAQHGRGLAPRHRANGPEPAGHLGRRGNQAADGGRLRTSSPGTAASGGAVFGAGIAARILASAAGRKPAARYGSLTDRECGDRDRVISWDPRVSAGQRLKLHAAWPRNETRHQEPRSSQSDGRNVLPGYRSRGRGIRTREGLPPTRFPSVRPRPLGESSAEKLTGRGGRTVQPPDGGDGRERCAE
jgi:hypothetical protein